VISSAGKTKADPTELGYKVDEAEAIHKKRKDEWEKGNTVKKEMIKKPVEELGYKVEEAEDIRKRKDEWEKGKPVSSVGQQKKPVEELGYKVDEAEDIKKRREEWEKGKQPIQLSARSDPEGAGYKVETSGVKDRLDKWNSRKEVPSSRKEPITISYKEVTKDDQIDVKTVKYKEEE